MVLELQTTGDDLYSESHTGCQVKDNDPDTCILTWLSRLSANSSVAQKYDE